MVGANGKLWEAWQLGNYAECTAPDNGSAGWFMENFRNLLVMEDGQIAVGRSGHAAHLAGAGQEDCRQECPYLLWALAYEIVSDVDHGKITATIEMPSRNPPKSVVVRFRHPKAATNQERDGQRPAMERFRPCQGSHPLARRAWLRQGGDGLLTFLFRRRCPPCPTTYSAKSPSPPAATGIGTRHRRRPGPCRCRRARELPDPRERSQGDPSRARLSISIDRKKRKMDVRLTADLQRFRSDFIQNFQNQDEYHARRCPVPSHPGRVFQCEERIGDRRGDWLWAT